MKIPLGIILLSMSQPTYSGVDSLRVYRMSDVVVTGTRRAVEIEKLPSSVRVVDSTDIVRTNGSTVADMIRFQAGISLRGYGGNGALHSVSVRGLGSDYSLVLVDGHRFTTDQISTVDLGILTMNGIERIEIANGGNSSIYGTNAIGGVINIITKKPDGNAFLTVGAHVGSFGQFGYQLSGGTSFGINTVRGSVNLDRSRNDYDFEYNDGTGPQSLRRAGSDYAVANAAVSIRTTMGDNVISQSAARYTDADRGQPAAVTSNVQNNLARIRDSDLFLSSTTDIEISSAVNLSIPMAYHFGAQWYDDPNVVMNGTPLSAHYHNRSVAFSPVVRYAVARDHMIDGGIEIGLSSIASNELHSVHREQGSVFIASQHTFLLPIEVIIFPSLRMDSYNDVDGALSPRLGLNVGLSSDPLVRFRSSIGRNYRVPTFNDLYWIDGGNPLLKPERSLHADAGIVGEYRFNGNALFVESNVFLIEATDKIVWQPIGGSIWSPKNLQSVSSGGIEVSATARLFSDLLMLHCSYTTVRAIKTSADGPGDMTQNKFLPYVPRQHGTISAGTAIQGFTANVTYMASGYRYESADNNPRYFLPSYDTVDLNVSQQFVSPWFYGRAKIEINNVTNTSYQNISGYPVPLRNYRLFAEVTI